MLLPDNSFVVDWIGFQIFWLWIVPDEGYWAYLMKVIPETYPMKVIERTWWRLL